MGGGNIMRKVCIVAFALVALSTNTFSQEAKTVVGAASTAMGVDRLTSIHYYGTAQNGNLGQNNNANQPWPMTNANDYVRAIDFSGPASLATWTTYVVPVTGGAAALAAGQQNITPQNTVWAQQLEIWITPWGFLKGAAANGATVRSQTVDGKRYQVVTFSPPAKSPGEQPYKMVGYISNANLVERVQTWLDHPVFGDMLIEADYLDYRDAANGLKFPSRIVQKRAGWPVFNAYILGANANPANLRQLLTPPSPGGGAPGAPAGPVPARPASAPLGDGVFWIKGQYNALAIEFADHIVLFEPGPQSLSRAVTIIGETKKIFPNKPIRFGVISHHHIDHTMGIAAVAAEGITIVTPQVNRKFLMDALSTPRTLAPDSFSKSGKKPVVEGFTGDVRIFKDATRTFEVHVIKGLPHADGLVVGYLPKEKILVYADMFNLPPANSPVPNPPVVGTMVFLDNIERLKLDLDRILSVHSLNPDRLTSVADIRASLGRR
jgi:glyoxylase-like metal-dependent hydrolase (beta-lactamase superfamily II)